MSPPPIGLLSTVYWSTIRLLNPEDCRGKDGRKDYFIHLLLKLFFLEHNIILNWIGPCNEKGFILDEKGLRREYGYIGECKGGWGDYDYDTESWTGVIGQVTVNC